MRVWLLFAIPIPEWMMRPHHPSPILPNPDPLRRTRVRRDDNVSSLLPEHNGLSSTQPHEWNDIVHKSAVLVQISLDQWRRWRTLWRGLIYYSTWSRVRHSNGLRNVFDRSTVCDLAFRWDTKERRRRRHVYCWLIFYCLCRLANIRKLFPYLFT